MTFHLCLCTANQFSVTKFPIFLSSVSYFMLIAQTVYYMRGIYEYHFPLGWGHIVWELRTFREEPVTLVSMVAAK